MRANTNRAGALSFGSLVADYDAGRPRLSAEFLAAAALRVGLPSVGAGVEVGAGTGQLTGALLRAGWTVQAIEPSAPMAERLAQRYRAEVATGQLVVTEDEFESFNERQGRTFDAIWSADAWHWVDPAAGYRRAADLLRPAGQLVAIWTMAGIVDDLEVASQLNEVYSKLSPDLVRDTSMPIDESALREGRDEINASGVMVVTQHWTETERRFLDYQDYVAWQLSYAHIADMGKAERGLLSGAITDTLKRSPLNRQVPVRIWRYIVASERVAD